MARRSNGSGTNRDSVTYLPAKKVAAACGRVIEEIESDRIDLSVDLALEWRSRNKLLYLRRIQWLIANLPPGMREVVKFHRAEEWKRAENLSAMAKATMRDLDPSFTIQVTESAFELIRDHYEGTAEN